MQDVIAIAVALAAGAWLLRRILRHFVTPPCGPAAVAPPGADGFVPLDALRTSVSAPRPRPPGDG